MITEEVPLSRTEQFSILAINALNVLVDKYCCPDCCAQCSVLAGLLISGELDEVVNQAPRHVPRHPVWQTIGAHGRRVNRTWLYSRWNPDLNHCRCSQDPEELEPEVQVAVRKPKGPRTAKTKACEAHRQARKKCTCRPEPAVI